MMNDVPPPHPAGPASPDEVLAALDPDQREVASSPLGAMCVLAGAGSGKTRAITHRIAYGVASGAYRPTQVLAVTFTARAAGEMRTRLRGLGVEGVQARTFHSAALRQLHYFWPRAVGGAAPEIMSHKAGIVAEAASRLRIATDRAVVRDLAAEIEWAKVSMLTEETYAQVAAREGRETAGVDPQTMARLLTRYEDAKTARGVIDFEDVLLLMVGILSESEEIAREVRGQYRHFVVDEYQDVNAVQQRLLDLWVGQRHDVCVVGDPAQTIYSFTGASPTHLTDFTRRHPTARVVQLTRNYRSSPQVVDLANRVLAGAGGPPRRLVAQGEAGPVPTLSTYSDDAAEAVAVAATAKRRIDAGTPAAEIAVLYRTNAQSEALEDAFSDAGIPYLVRGGERFFSRPEVKRGILLLRGAVRADDPAVSLPNAVGDVLSAVGWSPEPPVGRGAVREQWESLDALVQLAVDLVGTDPDARMRDLVADLDERAAAQHAPTVQGVTLASLHAAKGLEWDVVFVVGVSEGLVPISMAEGAEAVEEERRLLYVGLTRARRELHLSWAQSRTAGGSGNRRPSRFLAPAAGVLGDGARASRGGGTRAAPTTAERRRTPRTGARRIVCRGCGTVLHDATSRTRGRCEDCPPVYDEALFERLREWRLAVASAVKIPPYAVFTDATLEAVAQYGPTDRAMLSKIRGVGARKLALYGDDVLAVVAGEDPAGD
ncbi:ATP-dependent DNA helicase UvrD2 [Mobilicoccus pelagius]|uniref:DNA 3'-5' helicase n=1 Tax=Mobilicoccus pelagius NBRC 104925 TaxID=1089455 RepID=H5URQ8_9MICO|nr:ATP-dependent DNA helicase UvrD2 [Mobilicoccus pelagius]GAB48416.1 putative ATP-dependent DNA helicase [Mobilicoccus pelagius NBRC 104925]